MESISIGHNLLKKKTLKNTLPAILIPIKVALPTCDSSISVKHVAFFVSPLRQQQPLPITVKKVVEHESQFIAPAYYLVHLDGPGQFNAIAVEMHSFRNERDAKIKQLSINELLMQRPLT